MVVRRRFDEEAVVSEDFHLGKFGYISRGLSAVGRGGQSL